MNSRRRFLHGSAILLAATVCAARSRRALAQGFEQVPAVRRFRIGETTVTALSDGFIELSADAFPEVSAAEFDDALEGAYLPVGSGYQAPVNAYVVQRGNNVSLIDTGAGSAFGDTTGRLQTHLDAAGIDPATIARILLTHLHPDHSGGLIGEAALVAPEATLAVADSERAFWTDDGARAQAPENFRSFFDMAREALAAFEDRLELIDGERDLGGGLSSIALPGHTPGHTGFRIDDGDESLLIWGDIVHVAPLQLARPAAAIAFDTDAARAIETRRSLLERVVADRIRVAGMHMPFPGVGYLESDGDDGYRLVPDGWDYSESAG